MYPYLFLISEKKYCWYIPCKGNKNFAATVKNVIFYLQISTDPFPPVQFGIQSCKVLLYHIKVYFNINIKSDWYMQNRIIRNPLVSMWIMEPLKGHIYQFYFTLVEFKMVCCHIILSVFTTAACFRFYAIRL